jgi:hypothetical protein
MLFTALIFIFIGLLLKNVKMYNLIAGYNTMSVEEKAKYNIEAIATLFRNVMFFMASLITIGFALSKLLEEPSIESISFWIALGIGIPYLLIRSNSKNLKSNG